MQRIWNIHNDQPLDLVGGGFVSIGWDNLGDLSKISKDRDSLKALLVRSIPDAKAGAIPVWAGILSKFVSEIQVGDLVVSPNKKNRTINIGKVSSDYYYDPTAEVHVNRRKVVWLKLDIPRSDFPQSALNEIGSTLTLFEIKRHRDVIEGLLQGTLSMETDEIDQVSETVEDEPNAKRVESYSLDFVASTLGQMDPVRFEHFVAAVLRALGYYADVTQASGDGGVDVLASRDPLRLAPPVIKVQVKRTTNAIGAQTVQALLGTLSPGGNELALFVTLGNFTADAVHIARTRQDLRLLSGKEFIDIVFEHYDKLDPESQRLIPMRRVYAVERDI